MGLCIKIEELWPKRLKEQDSCDGVSFLMGGGGFDACFYLIYLLLLGWCVFKFYMIVFIVYLHAAL